MGVICGGHGVTKVSIASASQSKGSGRASVACGPVALLHRSLVGFACAVELYFEGRGQQGLSEASAGHALAVGDTQGLALA
eukprot:10427136-Lingulodinium_polyedra.AAC.2